MTVPPAAFAFATISLKKLKVAATELPYARSF